MMPSLQVRDLPGAIYLRLAERARREHRTLSQEATVLLAQALEVSLRNVERRRSVLDSLLVKPLSAGTNLHSSPEDLIREDRNR